MSDYLPYLRVKILFFLYVYPLLTYLHPLVSTHFFVNRMISTILITHVPGIKFT